MGTAGARSAGRRGAKGDIDGYPSRLKQLAVQFAEKEVAALTKQREALLAQRDALGAVADQQKTTAAAAKPLVTVIEGTGTASTAAAEGVQKLVGAQARLAEAGKILLKTSAQEERIAAAAEAAQPRRDMLRTLEQQIEQQQLLIRFAGEETEEYRVQLRLLELKQRGIDVTPELERQVRLLEQQSTAIEAFAQQ
jgi:hypothetical protein